MSIDDMTCIKILRSITVLPFGQKKNWASFNSNGHSVHLLKLVAHLVEIAQNNDMSI